MASWFAKPQQLLKRRYQVSLKAAAAIVAGAFTGEAAAFVLVFYLLSPWLAYVLFLGGCLLAGALFPLPSKEQTIGWTMEYIETGRAQVVLTPGMVAMFPFFMSSLASLLAVAVILAALLLSVWPILLGAWVGWMIARRRS